MKATKSPFQDFLKRDCSMSALRIELIREYGKTAEQLIADKSFNIWEAYSHLKSYCGMNNLGELGPDDFATRSYTIAVILEMT